MQEVSTMSVGPLGRDSRPPLEVIHCSQASGTTSLEWATAAGASTCSGKDGKHHLLVGQMVYLELPFALFVPIS